MNIHDEYRAIHEGAAIGAIGPRRQIAVAGNDRAAFLQGLLTNDIPALAPGTGCYSAWLTPQGRMLTDMHVLESGSMILLDVPADQEQATLQRLDQFLFSEDVRLESMDGKLTGVWIHGPESANVLTRTIDAASIAAESALADWPEYHHVQLTFSNEPVVVARISQLGVPGFCAYLSPARQAEFVAALQRGGAQLVGDDAIQAARVEAGYPLFGTDMTDDTIPL